MYLLKWISHGSSPLPDNGFTRFVQPDQLRFVGILDEQFFSFLPFILLFLLFFSYILLWEIKISKKS